MTSIASGMPRDFFIGGCHANDRIGDPGGIVILHVATDAAQFMDDGHADVREVLWIADAGQLQDER